MTSEAIARQLAALELGESTRDVRPCTGRVAWDRAIALYRLGSAGRLAYMLRSGDSLPSEIRPLLEKLIKAAKPAKSDSGAVGRPQRGSVRFSISPLFKPYHLSVLSAALLDDVPLSFETRLEVAEVFIHAGRKRGGQPKDMRGLVVDAAEIAALLAATRADSAKQAAGSIVVMRKGRLAFQHVRSAERRRQRMS